MRLEIQGGEYISCDATEIAFNEDGADTDFRVEGATATSLLHCNAGTNRVGVNTAAPLAMTDIVCSAATEPGLYVRPAASQSANIADIFLDSSLNRAFTVYPTGIVINENSQDYDFRIETDTSAFALVIDSGANTFTINDDGTDMDIRFESAAGENSAFTVNGANGYVGMGVNNATTARLVINNHSATSGVPCVELIQDDVDQQFIDFDGTETANAASSLSSWTTGGSINGFIRISVNSVDRWIPTYSAPTA
jgi:hypothetical protein